MNALTSQDTHGVSSPITVATRIAHSKFRLDNLGAINATSAGRGKNARAGQLPRRLQRGREWRDNSGKACQGCAGGGRGRLERLGLGLDGRAGWPFKPGKVMYPIKPLDRP